MKKQTVLISIYKGQIFLEALFFIACLLGFVITMNLFQKYAHKEINKHRLKDSQKKNWYFKKKHFGGRL